MLERGALEVRWASASTSRELSAKMTTPGRPATSRPEQVLATRLCSGAIVGGGLLDVAEGAELLEDGGVEHAFAGGRQTQELANLQA